MLFIPRHPKTVNSGKQQLNQGTSIDRADLCLSSVFPPPVTRLKISFVKLASGSYRPEAFFHFAGKCVKENNESRRLLSLAAVLDGMSREEAARTLKPCSCILKRYPAMSLVAHMPSCCSTAPDGIPQPFSWSHPTSRSSSCRRAPRNSIRLRTSGNTCAPTGSLTASSKLTTTSSMAPARHGAGLSINPI